MPDFIAKKKLFVCEKAKSNRTEVYAEPIEIYAEPVEAKSNRAEPESNRAEVKTNRAETDYLCAIKKNLFATRFDLLAIR